MVRKMARMAILRYAQQRGHTVITGKIVQEVTELMCPVRPEESAAETPVAQGRRADRSHLPGRDRKGAGSEPTTQPTAPPAAEQTDSIHWSVEALARLARVPAGFMRDATRQRIERYALEVGADEITLEVAEQGIARAKQAMKETVQDNTRHAGSHGMPEPGGEDAEPRIPWTEEAEQALLRVPEGFMRDLTRQRVEAFAGRLRKAQVTTEVIDAKYAEWGEGSASQRSELDWDDDALVHVGRIPEFVRGMVIKEVETCARRMGAETVSMKVLETARRAWQEQGAFHSENSPRQFGG